MYAIRSYYGVQAHFKTGPGQRLVEGQVTAVQPGQLPGDAEPYAGAGGLVGEPRVDAVKRREHPPSYNFV